MSATAVPAASKRTASLEARSHGHTGTGSQRGLMAAQSQLARLSTNSIHRTASGATHAELLETRRFAAITAAAIRSVVEAAR